MKHKRLHILTAVIAIVLVVSVSFNIVLAVNDGNPEPGSDEDPIVTKSYVDSLISKYENEIKLLKEEISKLKNENITVEAKGFESVSVKANQNVLTGKGTEIIFKSGKATAIKGKSGALTDINQAKELANGAQIVANHLLISALDDGRGFKTSAQSSVLIKGSYTLQAATGGETKPPDTGVKDSAPLKGKVTASSLNIRAEASTTSKIVGSLVKNEEVTILSKTGQWYRIKTSKGVTGWVMGTYIK